MKDRYDIFGTLPDVIEDDWIEDIENLDEKLREFTDEEEAGQRLRPALRGGRDRRRPSMGALRTGARPNGRHEAAFAGMGRAGTG